MACELCTAIGGELLWRDARCRVALVKDDDYPGYCRVIWNTHVAEMTDLAPDERGHLMAVVFAVETVLRRILAPQKINLASLGNLTPHLHWHVIPRRPDDRHFPGAIWGAPQRVSSPSSPPDLETALRRALLAALDER